MLALAGKKTGLRPQVVVTAKVMVIVASVVFIASLLGILTRPVGFLAAFWPANAILLGLMVRNPGLASVWGWIAAFCGYMAADLATGSKLGVTLWLTAANLAGAITGFFLFQLLAEADRRLQRPLSVLYLFVICATAALVAAFTGGGAALMIFDRDFLTGLQLWFVTELVNSLIILPIILTFPGLRDLRSIKIHRPSTSARSVMMVAPVLMLIASVVAGMIVGGPGVIAFPGPALIWCALTYPMFVTAVVTMLLCAWLLIATATGLLPLPMLPDALQSTSSIRLGVALTALAPLTVASINAARNELLAKLAHAVNHDALTGTLSRSAFMGRAEQLLTEGGIAPLRS